tara:strand:+ start:142 stop:525 length:384 start_codon:yes stop_codon:yes gene_type:complete
MNIKKLLVGSMFSMLLASEMAAADWGDVYYCSTTSIIETTFDGKLKRHKPYAFQFKLDQARNAMVFGSKGFFQDQVYEIIEHRSVPSQELWIAMPLYAALYFNKGQLSYASAATEGTFSITAYCEKF